MKVTVELKCLVDDYVSAKIDYFGCDDALNFEYLFVANAIKEKLCNFFDRRYVQLLNELIFCHILLKSPKTKIYEAFKVFTGIDLLDVKDNAFKVGDLVCLKSNVTANDLARLFIPRRIISYKRLHRVGKVVSLFDNGYIVDFQDGFYSYYYNSEMLKKAK